MLEHAAGLSERALGAIAELERRVVEVDGGRLKLEWKTLRRRGGDRVEDLLWWQGERLLGFLGLYRYGSVLELAGMVAPAARRRGIGAGLLDAAISLCRERGHTEALLIVPRSSEGGRQLALRRGGRLDHSEHALVLAHEPAGAPGQREITLRTAAGTDLPVVARLLELGFGHSAPEDLERRLEQTLVIELNGSTVGTIGVSRDGREAGVYGFVIEPGHRGRGIGREALSSLCAQLRAGGASRIRLEVETENDRALGLYTSVGFTPVSTEDYFALPA